jgi:hypothetical protein
MQKLILTAAFILMCISKIYADELTEGYKSFIDNHIQQAYQHFTAASQISETRAEAYLMLSLLSTVDKDNTTAFKYFLDFYKNSLNINPYAMGLVHHKSVLGYEIIKTEEQVNWMQDLVKRPDINSTLKVYVLEDLGKYYEAVHDIKRSREYLSNLNYS